MIEVNLKITFSLPHTPDNELLYNELADSLWQVESDRPGLFDSFIGGSLKTGEIEMSISARAENEQSAKASAEEALEHVLTLSGLKVSGSKQEVLQLS